MVRVRPDEWLATVAGVRPDEILARHSQFGVGGPADWFITVTETQSLATLVARCHEGGVTVTALGAGSNALIQDAGVRGLSGEAQRIVREFVAREGTLSARDRAHLATEIAVRIRPHITGIDASDDVAFLRAVAATLREAGERRS